MEIKSTLENDIQLVAGLGVVGRPANDAFLLEKDVTGSLFVTTKPGNLLGLVHNVVHLDFGVDGTFGVTLDLLVGKAVVGVGVVELGHIPVDARVWRNGVFSRVDHAGGATDPRSIRAKALNAKPKIRNNHKKIQNQKT